MTFYQLQIYVERSGNDALQGISSDELEKTD
jgi:hypothetical protein